MEHIFHTDVKVTNLIGFMQNKPCVLQRIQINTLKKSNKKNILDVELPSKYTLKEAFWASIEQKVLHDSTTPETWQKPFYSLN